MCSTQPTLRARLLTLILFVAIKFPFRANGGFDCNHHTQTHGQTESDLFFSLHIQTISYYPWKGSKDKVHNDVVVWAPSAVGSRMCQEALTVSPFLELASEMLLHAELKSIVYIVTWTVAYSSPLDEDL